MCGGNTPKLIISFQRVEYPYAPDEPDPAQFSGKLKNRPLKHIRRLALQLF